MAASNDALLLLDPVGKTRKQLPDHITTAAAMTSFGEEDKEGEQVAFSLEEYGQRKGVRLLLARYPARQDPYSAYDIPSFPVVVRVDKDMILLCLRTPAREVPTEYFVYCITAAGADVRRLPKIDPEIYCSSSVGLVNLVNRGGAYVVANLRMELNEETDKMEAHLDRWSPSFKDKGNWIQDVVPHLPNEVGEETICEWETDHVISLGNFLVWVDLWRGILWCSVSDLLFDELGGAGDNEVDREVLQYVALPPDMHPRKPMKHAHRERPEPFRSAACCQGKLKLVNLRSDGNSLEIEVWSLDTSNWSWTKDEKVINYEKFWDTAKDLFTPKQPLPRWGAKPHCFPVLSTFNSRILYLTLATQKEAFLMRIDMDDKNKVRRTEYPPFCEHRNPLQLVDVSNYTTTNPKDPTVAWDQVNLWSPPKSKFQPLNIFRGLRRRSKQK